MTLYKFVDGGPLDMIMGSIVISNAVVMFASGSVNTVGKASELCTPNFFKTTLPKNNKLPRYIRNGLERSRRQST